MAHPLKHANVATTSNSKSSITLIYQNNLNGSDDKNHIGALVLDAVPQADVVAACAAFKEKPLSKAALQQYQSGFFDALPYQDYAKYNDAGKGYYIDNGIVSVHKQLNFGSDSRYSKKDLPVLCTQSANNGSSNTGPVDESEVTIASSGNTFVGYRNKKSFRFLGIPYADTPQRFKYSSVYSKKGQIIQATSYGSQCAQGGSGSEDCLFLNVQTPYLPKAGSKQKLRPVMFWIHGGGFTGGSGVDALSDGGNLARKEDVVVVSINYRLFTLGFLASAGAGSVRTLLGSPQAIGKFQGAVSMSNLGGGVTLGLKGDYGTTYSTYYTIDQSYAVAGPQIFLAVGCNGTNISSQIACLEKVPASALVGASTVARYVVQDGKYVNTPDLILSTRNGNTAHIPTPIANITQGLEVALGINSTWAEKVIASNLFPLTNTGNLTLDSFNVSQRIATDKTFRCVDQATVYAGAQTKAFQKAYYYQFERTIGGYDPNNLGGPKDNNPKNPYFRFHGADMPWVFGTLSTIREPEDLWSELVSSYFASFIRDGAPNPNLKYLQARNYDKVIEGVKNYGQWNPVDGGKKSGDEVRHLDWPSTNSGFVDVEQYNWLGYPLDYYLKGGT
ncbi:acetylcholinesterase precursor [Lizonia empirigonia]|nr:acetylcholinesterase precursor [Lizonia empirigonia]